MQEFLVILQSLSLSNLDLLSVGIVVAATSLLAFTVSINDFKSSTSKAFLFFSIVTILWSFFNYVSYQVENPDLALILWKVVIFLALWHAFSFFNFLYVFPKNRISFPFWYTRVLLPYTFILSLVIVFTPFVFISMSVGENSKLLPVEGGGIILFALTAIAFVIVGAVTSVRRLFNTVIEQRKQHQLLLSGIILTLLMLLTFNLVLPSFFSVTRFIPLGAVAIFPFVIFTAYAIFKHQTFKIRHLSSSLMAFFLCVATFVEIVFADSLGVLILRSGIFVFVLLISIQFVKNITALENIKKNLEEANEQLKSLDKLKSEFISLASHQLRSPLTVIKGYASTLTDGVVGDLTPKQNEIVHHIYTAAQGLASMVEDFLNVTKIEQGGMQYSFEVADIRQIVNDLSSDMKIAAEDKHLTFNSFVEDDMPYFTDVDKVKIKQVFLNLIDNSIKYTKEGFVTVSLRKDPSVNMYIFSVKDSGIGISNETKKKLFTKFGRGEGSGVNGGGSGLGLYLAQEIIKAHHGEIRVASEGVGKGSEFSVLLPIKKS